MEHLINKASSIQSSRYGFHYFPDSLHYRDEDLQLWLPELQALGASWLVLISESTRAIPETFIQGLIQAGISPIVHFPFAHDNIPSVTQIEPILSAYAKWGLKKIIFFDRPNSRNTWENLGWNQQDLVQKFSNQFIQFAGTALKNGLEPVFPPLEPGGPYLDTTFLRQSLEFMQSQNQNDILDKLILSAYAWTQNKILNWGIGGPEKWPLSKPYRTSSGSEDQRGFRIFDWYLAISRAVLQKNCSIILLQTGTTNDPWSPGKQIKIDLSYKPTVMSILQLLNHENVYEIQQSETPVDEIPDEVIASNFWLLSTNKDDPYAAQAWYQNIGQRSPTAQSVLDWHKAEIQKDEPTQSHSNEEHTPAKANLFSISRYLLLPSVKWLHNSEEHLEIKTFIEKYHPTIGFSLQEAANSAVVCVAGNEHDINESDLEILHQSGCLVKRLVQSDKNDCSGDVRNGKNAIYQQFQRFSS